MALKNTSKLKNSPSTSGSTIMTVEEFRRWLMKFDSDGDGHISKEELQKLIRRTGGRFSHWKSRKAFKTADTDGDGYIDVAEIENMADFAKKAFGIKIVPY